MVNNLITKFLEHIESIKRDWSNCGWWVYPCFVASVN